VRAMRVFLSIVACPTVMGDLGGQAPGGTWFFS
jgi:hypothetical protein